MKWIALCFLAVVLAFTGCSKSVKPPADAPPTRVPIDLPGLRDAFAAASPQVQAIATRAVKDIQTDNWAAAGAELEKLGANSSLTDDQKKIVREVLEQLKANMARQPAPPPK